MSTETCSKCKYICPNLSTKDPLTDTFYVIMNSILDWTAIIPKDVEKYKDLNIVCHNCLETLVFVEKELIILDDFSDSFSLDYFTREFISDHLNNKYIEYLTKELKIRSTTEEISKIKDKIEEYSK